MTSNLPAEIRRWVKDEKGLDVKTRVRFRNLADEIQRLDVKADKAKSAEAIDAIRSLCENVDVESREPLQGWLAENVLAILDGKPANV